jgi:type II secretory pathway component PulK
MRTTDTRGSAVIAAILSLAILTCMGGALAPLMRTETDSSINFRDGIAAQYIAEAGLRRALVVLYKNGNPQGLSETITRDFYKGSYQVLTSAEGTALRVRSTGKVGGAGRSVSALVSILLDTTPDQPFSEITILSWDN